MHKILMKHQFTDARDVCIEWCADFGKMTLDLKIEHQPIVSPFLMLDFLASLPNHDDRFGKTGITDPLQITSEFVVTMSLVTGNGFRVYAYRPGWPENSPLQLEFIEVANNKES